MVKKRGAFITFEGPEGSGKSTVLKRVAKYLRSRKMTVVELREPGGTTLGEKVRGLLLYREDEMTMESELLLYLAARAQIVRERIVPALEKGAVVLCDRFHDSTVAYQGYAGKLPISDVQRIGNFAKGGVQPDLTLLMDVSVNKGLARAGRRDAIEKRSLTFHRKVRKGFLDLAKKNPKRFVVIEDEKTLEKKLTKVEKIVARFLEKRSVNKKRKKRS